MLSKKAKYGLKALLFLARRTEERPVLIAELARSERIPRKFLELILLDLKRSGILYSRKGRGGGYLLRADPATTTLGSVIRLLDGPLAPVPCASVTGYVRCAECDDEYTCGIRLVMRDVRDAIADILDGTSLEDVVRRTERARRRARRKAKACHRS